MSAVLLDWFSAAAHQATSFLGGGALETEVIDMPPGTTFTSQDLMLPGAITIGEHIGGASIGFPRYESASPIETYVLMIASNLGIESSSVAVRLIARGLGYDLMRSPDGLEACDRLRLIDLESILCATHGLQEPTLFDAAIGRALYTRRVGNRQPDLDPRPE